jgi:hypothetical protein
MRSLMQFSFALMAAMVLNLLLAAPQRAQIRSEVEQTKIKRNQRKALEPTGAPVTAANYLVAQSTGTVAPGATPVTGFTCASPVPGDDCTATVALPFSYTFYDLAFSSVNVSTNGHLQFNSNVPGLPLDACLPLTTYSYAILAHHGDLTIGGANEGIFTSVSGSAPNRIFNIEWRASQLSGLTGSLNFEIRLYEGQARFDIVYGTVPGAGRMATVGAQQGTGATMTEFECFGSNTLRNGQLLIFTGTSETTRFIAGRVTNPDGNAIAGAIVTLSGDAAGMVTTDGTGDYAFTGLTPGGSYTVTVSQAGFTFFPASRSFGGGGRAFNGNFIVNFIRTTPPNPGDILISEFRFRGKAFGPIDEFVEVVNNTDQGITVNVTDGSAGWLVQASRMGTGSSLASFIIPNGTTIPARGHYLAGNGSGYNLIAYAPADVFFDLGVDIPDDGGVAIFTSAITTDFAHRLDAVGFTGEPDPLYREGTGLVSPGANNGNYSFVRKLRIGKQYVLNKELFATRTNTGKAKDTNINANDFAFVATDGGNYGGVQAALGAPGPEGTASPIQHNAQIKASLIDSLAGPTAPPNRVRDLTPVTNGTQGTLTIRRKFTNVTGMSVTRLRFRIVDITTLGNIVAGQADLRALNSTGAVIPITGGTATVRGLTVEEGSPSATIAQPLGGGLNTSLGVGVITVGQPLSPGDTVNVEFRLGVQQGGSFRFFINVEALP